MSEPGHQHKFVVTAPKKVLLARFRQEDGESKYHDTTGYDLLFQRACKCGLVETYDLARTKL